MSPYGEPQNIICSADVHIGCAHTKLRPFAAPTVIHVHHDTEAHARSFNEGYEAAVTQGLADDPTLADDWFQDKLREARAQALEDAADIAAEGGVPAYDSDDWAGWLRSRAVAERGEG